MLSYEYQSIQSYAKENKNKNMITGSITVLPNDEMVSRTILHERKTLTS